MSKNNLSDEDIRKIREAIYKEISSAPPTIGLVGVSGVGKSSTINTLFKTNLPTSDTVACTKEFQTKEMQLQFTKGNVKNMNVRLNVIDAPGLGENIKYDSKYLKMYEDNLPKCDTILWIITGRNRAIALDQHYLLELNKFHEKMVFGMNQVDLIEPLDWNKKINLPSQKQIENMKIIIRDREEKLSEVIERNIKIIPYSAKLLYNMEELFATILDSIQEKRRWIFDNLKNFDYRDFIPAEIKDQFINKH